VHHGGNVDGFTALVAMMPEEQFGIVLLTNMNGTPIPTVLMQRIFDLQLEVSPRDWSGVALSRRVAQRARAAQAQQRAESQRVANTKPSLPLSAYVGTYSDSLYGDLTIREEGGKLALSFGPTWNGVLDHWHFDTFRVRFATPVLPPVPVTFRLNAAGKVDEVELDMAGIAQFKRRPDAGAPESR
jgi:hypothetical protein